MNGGGGRGVAALTGAICAIAVVVYASSLPRDPVSLLTSPAASGHPMAARPATPAQPVAAEVDLSIVVWSRGPGHGRRAWALQCPPVTASCRVAMRRSRVLAQEDHGPCRRTRPRVPEAFISGYVNGRYVAAWLDQRDGCGVARWRSLAGLLERPPAPRPSATAAAAERTRTTS